MRRSALRWGLFVATLTAGPERAAGFFSGEIDSQRPVLLSSDHLAPLCFPAATTPAELRRLRRRCCYPQHKAWLPECVSHVFTVKRCCRGDEAFRAEAEAKRRRLLECRATVQIRDPRVQMSPYAFSKHSPLGCLLWCAAREATTAFDLFMGEGGSAWLLADAMRERTGARVVTFEHFEGEVFRRVLGNVADFDPVVVEASDVPLEEFEATLASRGLDRLLTVFHGSPYPTYSLEELEDFEVKPSYLSALCQAMRPDFIVIDAPAAIVREWVVMEAHCKPSTVLIFNTNLPGHNGWIRDQLLTRGDWAEVLTGIDEDSNAHAYRGLQSLLTARHWSLLVRDRRTTGAPGANRTAR